MGSPQQVFVEFEVQERGDGGIRIFTTNAPWLFVSTDDVHGIFCWISGLIQVLVTANIHVDVAPAYIDEQEMITFKGGQVTFETWDWPNFKEQLGQNKFFSRTPPAVKPAPPQIDAQVFKALRKFREAKDGTQFLVIGNIDESFEPYLIERVRNELDIDIT